MPDPYTLYQQTGGGDAYRVAMLEHGHIRPIAPWDHVSLENKRRNQGKRADPCGLLHEPDWSDWRVYEEGGKVFGGRWCRVCARTNVRAGGGESQ